jgi:hypothetical protein
LAALGQGGPERRGEPAASPAILSGMCVLIRRHRPHHDAERRRTGIHTVGQRIQDRNRPGSAPERLCAPVKGAEVRRIRHGLQANRAMSVGGG